ncbi:MAG: hypothetical protein A3I77_04200 [Gammaproteobacteria bacterium RIFCSPLOWO2_02_FULL_42_14]|nr:MAG: hypothetical protein A3B71_05500 [Gammaproteobacteria bacterium RIFCSPHIGHO2_02_FULL_42_43]OGT28543.1 MAG: hypothetical protein A2624_00535 [Gammaproteobacteria bacterium RIFCSPHIGHO2_01_FULL_42_8]OGT51448.1 MAG: hypothetical protein A3E54_05265 [Gammaproteobacteria bacterium RIFCSPHIGHO2_12_FULL_41_25]OGT62150.1 MAG: hypothetical protein A3I77_04200 [Gammaproteobacteria bacterium RIFCSPLOWO2_02_FULL_42_14]OGT85822.1 MAG: hypothetical protein A3G86_03890 [Gammaproteobacteria bacterium R
MTKPLKNPHKKPANFRLSHQAMMILIQLEGKLRTSKTAVVEKALRCYANQQLKLNNTLMRFAGILSEKESDDMLFAIRSDRRNKTIKSLFKISGLKRK